VTGLRVRNPGAFSLRRDSRSGGSRRGYRLRRRNPERRKI